MWLHSNRWMLELLPLTVFAAVALIVFLWRRWCVYRNAKNPVSCIKAVVTDKRMTTCRGKRGINRIHAYYVTFRPADGGENMEFQVGEAEYAAYRWNDRGPLSYRAWEFISFKPERKSEGDIPVAFANEEDNPRWDS